MHSVGRAHLPRAACRRGGGQQIFLQGRRRQRRHVRGGAREDQRPGRQRLLDKVSCGYAPTADTETEKKNIVLIHLESVRSRSTTPYNEDLDTTPYLDALSKKSLI